MKKLYFIAVLCSQVLLGQKTPADYVNPFIGTSNFGATHPGAIVLRSEERRVGKECRSRWSPYH